MSNQANWQLLKNNPKLWPRYFVKEYVIKAARKFFEDKNYHELESPILTSALPQERYLSILNTDLKLKQRNKNIKAWMIPSTETFNKKSLAAGIGNHFVISKVFRGLEDIGPNHSPEFTMLEWYDLGANYFDLMEDCEQLILQIKHFIDHKNKRTISNTLEYGDQKIDLTPPYHRFSMEQVFLEYAQIDLQKNQQLEQIKQTALDKNYNLIGDEDWQTIFEWIFANEIESKLPADKPIFIYDFPKLLCPLTKINPQKPYLCEKVELYIAGKEIANGYTEQLDWKEQQKRFIEEQEARKNMGQSEVPLDHELIEALKSGLPEVAGIGMGIDRLAMLMANARSLSEINLFPFEQMFADELEEKE